MTHYFLSRGHDHHSQSATSSRHYEPGHCKSSSGRSSTSSKQPKSSKSSGKSSKSGSETKYRLHIYNKHGKPASSKQDSSSSSESSRIFVFNPSSKGSSHKTKHPSKSHSKHGSKSRKSASQNTDISAREHNNQYADYYQSPSFPANMSSPHAATSLSEGSGKSMPMPGLSGRANGPVGNLIKGPVDNQGRLKDAALMVGIKLDLEAEVHLTARVRGDVLVGLY